MSAINTASKPTITTTVGMPKAILNQSNQVILVPLFCFEYSLRLDI